MSRLTITPTQFVVPGHLAAVPLQPVTLFRNDSQQWIATTVAADALGATKGYFTLATGQLVIDSALSSGYTALIGSSHNLLTYSP